MATVTPRAIEVLLRGMEAARLDPAEFGVRVSISGATTRTNFADGPEATDATIKAGSVTLWLDASIAEDAIIDVTAEHDTLIVRYP